MEKKNFSLKNFCVLISQLSIVLVMIICISTQIVNGANEQKDLQEKIEASKALQLQAIEEKDAMQEQAKAELEALEEKLKESKKEKKKKTETENKEATAKYDYSKPKYGWQDGEYTGFAQGYGGSVSVVVTIKDGKITDVSATGNNETPSYWYRAQAVADKIISEQNPRVDAVSGATYSSNGIMNATIDALGDADKTGPKEQIIQLKKSEYSMMVGESREIGAKAKTKLSYKCSNNSVVKVNAKGKITAVGAGTAKIKVKAAKSEEYKSANTTIKVVVCAKPEYGWEDGKYTGVAQGYGGKVRVVVTIKDGKITEVKAEGKTETPDYWKSALPVTKRIVKAQSPRVDVVSGATRSSNGIMNAVVDALNKAVKSGPKEQTIYVKEADYSLIIGETTDIGAKAKTKLSYKSLDNSIIKVSKTGKITAVGAGTAKVEIKAAESKKYKSANTTINVVVSKLDQEIKIQGYSAGTVMTFAQDEIGQVINLEASALGDAPLIYESDNESVSLVDDSGAILLTGIGSSKIIIQAKETKAYNSAVAYVFIEVKSVDSEPEPEKPQFITGLFNGSGTGYGGIITAEVDIQNNIIVSIKLQGDNEDTKYWNKAIRIVKRMISAQSWDVDAISGATISSRGIKEAVKQALDDSGLNK